MNEDQNAPAWAEAPSATQEASATQAPVDTSEAAAVAEQKAALKAQKEQEAAAKKAEREEAKAAKAAQKAGEKEAKEAAKQAKLKAKEDQKAIKAAAIAAKNEAKAAKAAEREASKQPMQNGIRRPKPEGKCGQAWALFDRLSQEKGAPVSASEIRAELAKGTDLNEGNVKAEYPQWKKFHGLSGTIPAAAPLAPPPGVAAPQPTA